MKSFLKFLKILSIVFVVLIILGGIGLFFFIKTFDINRYKPQIINAVRKSTHRDLDFDRMSLLVSLKEGIRVNVKQLKLSDDPSFGTKDFVTLDDVYVSVDVLSYVGRKDLVITKLQVASPQVTIIRGRQGQFNFQLLAANPAAPSGSPSSSSPSTPRSSPTSSPEPPKAEINNVFIQTLDLTDGQITFIDQSVDPAIELSLKQLALKLDRFSLSNEPFSFLAEGALAYDRKNFRLEGRGQFDMKSSEIKLNDTVFSTDFGQWPLEKIKTLLSPFKMTTLPDELKGDLQVNIKQLAAGTKGVTSLLMDVQLSNASLQMPEIVPGVPLSFSQTDLKLKDFSLGGQPFHLSLQTGYISQEDNLAFDGIVKLDMAGPKIELSNTTASVNLSLLPITELRSKIPALQNIPFPQVLKGEVQAVVKNLSASAKGVDAVSMDLNYTNGQVSMKEAAPGISFDASQIDLKVHDLSLGQPFQFTLKAAYLGAVPNITIDGTALLDLKSGGLQLKDAKAAADLDQISLEQLKSSIGTLKDVPFPEVLTGKAEVLIKDFNVSSRGLSFLLDAQLHDGQMILNNLAPGISLAASQIDMKLNDFSLSDDPFKLTLSAAYLSDKPNINFDGTINLDLKSGGIELKDSTLDTDLAALSLADLQKSVAALKDVPLPQSLEGKVKTRIKELSAGSKGLTSMLLDIAWQDGKVSFKDAASGAVIDASQINLSVKDFSSYAKPFPFSLKAALLSGQPNIALDGTALYDLTTQNVQLNNTVFKTDLAAISPEILKSSVPALKDVPLPTDIKGNVEITIDQGQLGPKGLSALTAKGQLSNGSFVHPVLAVPVDKIQAQFRMTESVVNFDTFTLALGKSLVKGTGTINDYLKSQSFTGTLSSDGLDLAEILVQKDLPAKIQGMLVAKMNIQGQGISNGGWQQTLGGDGSFEIKDGRLKDLNVLKTVLSQLEMFPKVSKGINETLPEKYKAVLNEKDTIFTSALLTATISNGVFQINPAEIAAQGFAFTGTGQVKLNQDYNMNGSFYIEEELSAALVSIEERLKLLYQNNRITFPLKASKEGNKQSILPDFTYITERAILNYGVDQFKEKVLDKYFKKEESNPPADGQSAPSDQQQQPVERQIIENILDKILK